MNKKIYIPILFLSLLTSSLSFKNTFNASFADDVITFDNETIKALSHNNGITVNFVNSDIATYWNSDVNDIDNLKSLYEMNSEIASFANNAYDKQYVRYLYSKWDDFKPVNNTLTWRSNIEANSYDVVVSLNDELTETIYEAKGLTDCSYTLSNPYANTHYYWQVTAHKGSQVIKSSIFDFYSADYKRTIDIQAVSNTRDVGGFNTEYGYMKQGLIYRSGRLDDIDEQGIEDLNNLNIQTDLDLRSKGEGSTNPAHLPNYLLKTLISYTSDLNEENREKTIEAVRVFAEPSNYPVIFHCAVGRDRTGTLGMILQALAGASRDYIIHDYFTSMWSVTGAYSKGLEGLNLSLVNSVLDTLESYGPTLKDGTVNFLKQRRDTNTGKMVGLTDQEINMIRDIWSGKVDVEHALKPFKASENYEGKAFVKIKTLGQKDVSMMVNKGSIIQAPYTLDESLCYFSNGEIFDFSKPINTSTFIYTDYAPSYVVRIHFVGIAKQDEILKLTYGETLTFEQYELDGYDMTVLSDSGKPISKLSVAMDTCVNIIYMGK